MGVDVNPRFQASDFVDYILFDGELRRTNARVGRETGGVARDEPWI